MNLIGVDAWRGRRRLASDAGCGQFEIVIKLGQDDLVAAQAGGHQRLAQRQALLILAMAEKDRAMGGQARGDPVHQFGVVGMG